MGRSVSSPTGSYVTYIDGSEMDEDDFDMFVEYAADRIKEKYPSFHDVNDWVGREDRAFLRNRLVSTGVSEYFGLIALWVLPENDELEAFAESFALQVGRFCDRQFGELRKVATMWNGEVVFERIEKPDA